MCPSSGLWGGVLDCDSQFTILSPLLFDRPQLWRSVSVCSSLYLLTAHCALCSPSIPLWLASCLLAPIVKDTITWLSASYTCVTCNEEVVVFSLLYIKLFELDEVTLTTNPLSPTTMLICSNSHLGAATLSALMMLLCCSFASASFTSRNPSSLSVDSLSSAGKKSSLTIMKRNRKRKRRKRTGAKRRHIAGRAYDTGHGHREARQRQNGREWGSRFMLGSQRSHCHNKTNWGFVDSSEGVGRKGRMSSTTDRHRAGILDGHSNRQIRRLSRPRHSYSGWWI